MQATLMNYSYRHHHHQPMDDHFSPPSTPSPPMFPPRMKCRPSYMPYFHPQKQLYHSMPQEQRVARKRGFSIVELLGIGGDSDREVTYKCKPYPMTEATPRTALTALLPQSPEKLTDKYDSKCSKPHSRKPDDGESNSIYDILSPPVKPTPKSPPTQTHGGGKMKRIRTIFTPEQLERLESEFERQQYMVGPERLYLASTLNLSESQVKIWFQNRRIKWRKQHLELQQARLAQMREGGSPGEANNNREQSSPEPQHHQQQWDE